MGRSRAAVVTEGAQDIPNRISAELVIAAMKGLLGMRRADKITRITFLKTWTRLRRLLNLTPEYAYWRWYVRDRAGGACERCAEPGQHAHHRIPLAYDPDLALDPANGEYLCVRCHRKHHREESRARYEGRSHSRSPERASPAEPPLSRPRRPKGAPRR